MPPRYTNEFKEEAAKQILENRYPVRETAERLGVYSQSLSKWGKTIQRSHYSCKRRQ